MEVEVSKEAISVHPLAVIHWDQADQERRHRLLNRGLDKIFDPGLQQSIAEIVEDVREHGNAAVLRALERFDGCRLDATQLRVSDEEFEQARDGLDSAVLDAVRMAIANIRAFNEHATREREWRLELEPGLMVGERMTPIASVGLFIPSGKGSFPSVLTQLGTPAVVAGVPEIAVVVPPVPGGNGEVDPAVLAVAEELGLRNVFRANGPAGVAALAFGTETIPQVRKVVGPGSPPVQAAQIQCQRFGCHTQMLCGPSESLILTDDTADVRLLAADLLNEAEHGPDSSSLWVTHSDRLLVAVQEELARQLQELPEPRRAYAEAALGENGGCVLTSGLLESIEVADLYAPEHMQLVVSAEQEEAALARLQHAGEVLLGQGTPISAANYVIGVPAALPTGGFARVTSGITAETFLKRISIAKADGPALERMTPSVLALAEHEGFPAHAAAVRARQTNNNRPGGQS
jgi:histidinol dehydrogenase